MRVFPVYYATDPGAVRPFFEALGLTAGWASDSGGWISLSASGGGLGLHSVAGTDAPRTAGETDLSFESEEPLEQVADRLRAAGFEAEIVDESFGRSLRTTDPEGRPLQINEAMTDDYGYTDLSA